MNINEWVRKVYAAALDRRPDDVLTTDPCYTDVSILIHDLAYESGKRSPQAEELERLWGIVGEMRGAVGLPLAATAQDVLDHVRSLIREDILEKYPEAPAMSEVEVLQDKLTRSLRYLAALITRNKGRVVLTENEVLESHTNVTVAFSLRDPGVVTLTLREE